jgi:hypothetical protein
MKGSRHTPEQIVHKLHEADRLIAQSKSMAVVLKTLGISEQTYYRCRPVLLEDVCSAAVRSSSGWLTNRSGSSQFTMNQPTCTSTGAILFR